MKVRLNFSISVQLFDRLSAYCERVGRTPTDLIRQLILEFLDEEIPLPDMSLIDGPEKRTSLFLPEEVLLAFDGAARSYTVSKSRVVNGLVRLFLEKRNDYSDVSLSHEAALRALVDEIFESAPVDWSIEEIPPALKQAMELLEIKVEEISEC